ncbi:MAG: hypothetical protein KIT24_08630 [Phycisphaeraceae bacterium]|nr:hypothetical protein [Phycisphaeraceae bacterium]
MDAIRTIAIMLHKRQRRAPATNYRIWALAENWKRWGLKVELIWGPAREIDADLLIPHVDVSVIPDRYWEAMQRHPRVVNRRVRDIRKTVYSKGVLIPSSDWKGPVIVKTVFNSGGGWDAALARPLARPTRWRRMKRRLLESPWVERRRLGHAASLRRYYIFRSLDHVPRKVFDNPALFVERFVPERHGAEYVMRMLIVFGDQWSGRMLVGADPFVKDRNSRLLDLHEVPAEVAAQRIELGVDYGKLDYVMHDGVPVLLDVNITPTLSGPITEEKINQSAELARGLQCFGSVSAQG